jgi:subtilisin family serine protease
MSRRFHQIFKSVSAVRGIGLLVLVLTFGGLALANSNYILQVKGNNLQAVAKAHGLTVTRQIFSSASLSVGVVSASTAAASSAAQDSNVAAIELDQLLPAPAPVQPTLSQFITDLNAWLLSLESASQKQQSYLTQSGLGVINAPAGNQGAGVKVALIDTAVDTNHPLLAGKLGAGVDCVTPAGSTGANSCSGTVLNIWGDPTLNQSTVVILDQSTVVILDQSTVVILDQSTVVILDSKTAGQLSGQSLPSDVGHGTMVASLIAATAPGATILPIRAFNADGSANLSDVVAAIYYAANNGAQVINMSFDVSTGSDALAGAISFANSKGIVCVASAANANSNSAVYPAGYTGQVVGVGSVGSLPLTDLFKSSFSAYGQPSVDVYAPGESMIAAFPGGFYAVASGTSFSTALASGAAATLVSKDSRLAPGVYDNALTGTGPRILSPADGTRLINLQGALKSIH